MMNVILTESGLKKAQLGRGKASRHEEKNLVGVG